MALRDFLENQSQSYKIRLGFQKQLLPIETCLQICLNTNWMFSDSNLRLHAGGQFRDLLPSITPRPLLALGQVKIESSMMSSSQTGNICNEIFPIGGLVIPNLWVNQNETRY